MSSISIPALLVPSDDRKESVTPSTAYIARDDSDGHTHAVGLSDANSETYKSRPLIPNLPKTGQKEQIRQDVPPKSNPSPIISRRPAHVRSKRHANGNPSARKDCVKNGHPSSLASMSHVLTCEETNRGEIINVAEEVSLDDKAPLELKQLWDIRQKSLSSKGHKLWENITRDCLGHEEADDLGGEKRVQAQARLQMTFHRGVLRHAVWPARNRAALLRAYVRWEEDRYNEIFRLFMKELHKKGHAPAYEWKSIHVEAQLVKEGLEQKQREPSRARRRRVQITARQREAAGSSPSRVEPSPVHYFTPYHHNQSPQVISKMTPGLENHYLQQYGYQQRHQFDAGCGPDRKMLHGLSYNNMQPMQLNAQPQPHLTDEQHEQLIDECLNRTAFEADSEHLAITAIAALERLEDKAAPGR